MVYYYLIFIVGQKSSSHKRCFLFFLFLSEFMWEKKTGGISLWHKKWKRQTKKDFDLVRFYGDSL